MTLATRRRSHSPVSDEANAFVRVVLGLTLGVGGMAAALGAATGAPTLFVALPTVVLAVAGLCGFDTVAGWSGAAVWATLLPAAHGEALLAPLAMIVLCVAVALGPARLVSWVGDQLIGHHGNGEPRAPSGWIEENGRPVD